MAEFFYGDTQLESIQVILFHALDNTFPNITQRPLTQAFPDPKRGYWIVACGVVGESMVVAAQVEVTQSSVVSNMRLGTPLTAKRPKLTHVSPALTNLS